MTSVPVTGRGADSAAESAGDAVGQFLDAGDKGGQDAARTSGAGDRLASLAVTHTAVCPRIYGDIVGGNVDGAPGNPAVTGDLAVGRRGRAILCAIAVCEQS